MSPRRLLVVIGCVIVGLLGWIYLKPTVVKTTDTAEKTKVPVAMASAVQPMTIEAPKRGPVAPLAAPIVAPVPGSAAPTALSPASKFDLSNPQPQSNLNDCVAQTLLLLEAKDVDGVIKTLIPPTVVQQMIASGRVASIDDIVAQYRQRPDLSEKMIQMQQALESIKDQSPEMSTNGQEATFKLDPSATGPDGPTSNGNLTFVQVDGNWYLK